MCALCTTAALFSTTSSLCAQGLFFTPPAFFAQTDNRVLYTKPARWEVFAGPVLSQETILDNDDLLVLDYLIGAEAGVRRFLSSTVLLSLGGQYFPSPSKLPLASSFYSASLYAALRWYPLPDTVASFWVEGGGGWTQSEFEIPLSFTLRRKVRGAMFFAGMGNAFSLGKGWKVDFSFRLLHRTQTDFGFFFHYDSPVYRQAALFVSKQF